MLVRASGGGGREDTSRVEPAAVPTASTALRVLRLLDAALTGVGARGPIARDAVFAGLVTLASLLVLVPLLGPAAARMGLVFTPAERSLVLILVAVQTLFLVLRRVQPTICLIAVAALQVGLVAVLPVDAGIRMAAPVMAAYSVGAHLATRAAVRAVAAALGIEVLVGGIVAALVAPTARSLVEPSVGGSTWSTLIPVWLLDQASIMVLYVGAALAGMVVASRRSYTALLQEQMMAVVAQEQGRVRTAVATERSRMARELHDIAAHHLSGLVVQAGAIERLIDRDPEAAKRATGAVRAEGKETLANLRAVVGVLRESTPSTAADGTGNPHLDAESSAPVPGLAVVDQLLDAARTNGDNLDVSVAGEPYVLPPIADITSYRVLQESLANARQHAPGERVRIVLGYDPEQLELEVTNPLPKSTPRDEARAGYGLVGMQERAQLSGAALQAGPVERTWRVRLVVPRPLELAAGTPADEKTS